MFMILNKCAAAFTWHNIMQDEMFVATTIPRGMQRQYLYYLMYHV